jgi:hypothetical protein
LSILACDSLRCNKFVKTLFTARDEKEKGLDWMRTKTEEECLCIPILKKTGHRISRESQNRSQKKR